MKKLVILYISSFTCFFSCNSNDNPSDPTIAGCTDSDALNYNSEAEEDDGTCEYSTFSGPDVIEIDSSKINKKVLVVGIDGFRSDVMTEQITPFMYNLSQSRNGYYNLIHTTEEITYSGPNWTSMLTGVHQNKHGVLNNSFEVDNYNVYPPFFYYIEQAQSSINTASIVNWTPINTYTTSGFTDSAPTQSINDENVFQEAQDLLLNSEADILFLQFDELDGAGHSHGFSPGVLEYTNTANNLDSYVESLFNIVESKRKIGEDWIVFIISDHGGEEFSHGNAENPNIHQTVFFAEHPQLSFQADCCYFSSQVDLAPTILDFLGISSEEFDFNKDGNSVINP